MKNFPFFIILLLLTACYPGQGEGGSLNKKQVLNLNPDADYVELEDGTVYTHGVDWVEEKNVTKGERIGKVKEGMANVLPEGTDLFLAEELEVILIAEYDGKTIYYLQAMGE
jgi:hypothetical protein